MDIKRGDTLLSLKEAAASLGITADTLRRQAEKGTLRARRVGWMWTVTEREIERYRGEHLGKVGPKPKRQPKAAPQAP
jgi:excisionase family DNA binding protein